MPYTAFTSRPKAGQVTARLIVRRVKRLTPTSAPAGQGELLPPYRYHAVFTDLPLPMLAAEAVHRDHAIVEQVIADLKDSALAHLPSGVCTANTAWTVLAAMAFNLVRAAGVLASKRHARARTGTIRRHLIAVPARLARSARRLHLHLPEHWPWRDAWTALFTTATHHPPQRPDHPAQPARDHETTNQNMTTPAPAGDPHTPEHAPPPLAADQPHTQSPPQRPTPRSSADPG